VKAKVSARRPNPHPGPRVLWRQKGVSNDSADAIFLASGYGLAPDDWQAPIIDGWLARRRDGKWCHGRCGLAVPRQNGKNGAIEIRELYGMVILGEAILHTAHEVKTARKAFKRLKSFFGEKAEDPKAKYPELNALVREVRNTNGQEAIILKDVWYYDGGLVRSAGSPGPGAEFVARGGSVEFVARSSGSGRGFTVDVLILDEAQHLDDDELEAIRSAVSSAPLGNPQVIYAGTPPDEEKGQTGEVWTRVRSKANKDKRLCWIEYGAPDGPMPDPDDMDLLYAANPALGLVHANGAHGLQMDVISDEKADLSPEGYARERLGWWGRGPEKASKGVIDTTRWGELKVSASAPSVAQITVHTDPTQKWTSIALASQYAGDRVLVLVDRHEGTNVLAAIKTLIANLEETVEVALTNTSKFLSPRLTKAKIEHKVLTPGEVGAGCLAFQDMARLKTLAHVNQQVLNDAIANGTTKYVGDTQQWDQRNRSIDISSLVAGSVAAQRLAELTAKPKKAPPPKPVRSRATRRTAGSIQTVGF
jgi:hypothetical protein